MGRDIYGRFTSSRRREPKWLGIAAYAAWTAAMWWLFGWVAGATLIAVAVLLIAIALLKKQKAEDGF